MLLFIIFWVVDTSFRFGRVILNCKELMSLKFGRKDADCGIFMMLYMVPMIKFWT